MRILLAAMIVAAIVAAAAGWINKRDTPSLRAIHYSPGTAVDISAQRRTRSAEPFTPGANRP